MDAHAERFVDRDVAVAREGILRWEACISDAGKLAADALAEIDALREVCLSED